MHLIPLKKFFTHVFVKHPTRRIPQYYTVSEFNVIATTSEWPNAFDRIPLRTVQFSVNEKELKTPCSPTRPGAAVALLVFDLQEPFGKLKGRYVTLSVTQSRTN